MIQKHRPHCFESPRPATARTRGNGRILLDALEGSVES